MNKFTNSMERQNSESMIQVELVTKAAMYDIRLDELGRSKTFKVTSCVRPWFRSFHFSWFSFFLAFTGWFAIVPALSYIEEGDNGITKSDIKTSNILSVMMTIFVRFSMGPLCENFGARRIQCCLLGFGALFVALSSMIDNVTQLLVLRSFIGLIGGAFVPCQYWTTMMFASNVVGSANAFAGGWGNLGGGFANIFGGVMITVLRSVGLEDNVAWRVYMAIPSTAMLLLIIPMWMYSDDCPQGKWDYKLYNKQSPKNKINHYSEGFGDWRVWILALQYGCSFGIELTINNSMTNYLYKNFNDEGCIGSYKECSILGKDNSAIIAGCFGLMNLFARALGGLSSDYLNTKFGIRGRMLVQFGCLLTEGLVLIIFSRLNTLVTAIPILIIFSIFVQATEGSTFSLTPFMKPKQIATVSGIVGAGGNIGAVCWATMLKGIDNQADAYLYLGFIVTASSFLIFTFPIQKQWLLKNSNIFEENTYCGDSIASSEAIEISNHPPSQSII
jgi:MFS transporter, NNP family, nitrate/nitrite transporter